MVNPETLAASITAAAVTISKSLSDDDATLLAATLTQLGDTLTTIVQARSNNSQKQKE